MGHPENMENGPEPTPPWPKMAQQGPETHPDTNTDPPNWIPAPGGPSKKIPGHISPKSWPLFLSNPSKSGQLAGRRSRHIGQFRPNRPGQVADLRELERLLRISARMPPGEAPHAPESPDVPAQAACSRSSSASSSGR